MTTKKDNFNPDEPGIIAHSQVQVIASANWGETNIPVFNPGIRINLSLMAGEPAPWLRIHLSPDSFRVVKRTDNIVRLQHEELWASSPRIRCPVCQSWFARKRVADLWKMERENNGC